MQNEKLYHYRLVKKLQIYLKLKKQSVIRCLCDLHSLSFSFTVVFFCKVKRGSSIFAKQAQIPITVFVFHWGAVQVCRSSSQSKAGLRKQSISSKNKISQEYFYYLVLSMGTGMCMHVSVLRLSEGKSPKLCFVSQTRVCWVHKMVKEWFLFSRLLLDLLVSVIQGNCFQHSHMMVCVLVRQQSRVRVGFSNKHTRGFCSEKNKAAISASPDSCLFSQRLSSSAHSPLCEHSWAGFE